MALKRRGFSRAGMKCNGSSFSHGGIVIAGIAIPQGLKPGILIVISDELKLVPFKANQTNGQTGQKARTR
jgi:hypothetical protein